MKYLRTRIVPYMHCCICGKRVEKNFDGDGFVNKKYETVITKRNTEVVFHKECYKEMLKRQREGCQNGKGKSGNAR